MGLPGRGLRGSTRSTFASRSSPRSSDKGVGKKTASLIGSLADLVEHGVGVPEILGMKLSAGATKWMKGVGGVAGVMGGAIDALDYGFQTYEAVGEYDYGKAAGRGMQTGGAAASVCGSALALVATFGEAGSAVGPIGTLVGLAGGTLVATGHLVAKWLQLNANEVFAVRSFLGDQRANKAKEVPVPWSEEPLPADIPKKAANSSRLSIAYGSCCAARSSSSSGRSRQRSRRC